MSFWNISDTWQARNIAIYRRNACIGEILYLARLGRRPVYVSKIILAESELQLHFFYQGLKLTFLIFCPIEPLQCEFCWPWQQNYYWSAYDEAILNVHLCCFCFPRILFFSMFLFNLNTYIYSFCTKLCKLLSRVSKLYYQNRLYWPTENLLAYRQADQCYFDPWLLL